jgi:hypothetical protein
VATADATCSTIGLHTFAEFRGAEYEELVRVVHECKKVDHFLFACRLALLIAVPAARTAQALVLHFTLLNMALLPRKYAHQLLRLTRQLTTLFSHFSIPQRIRLTLFTPKN